MRLAGAILFSVICAVLALFLLMMSVHGPSVLAVAGPAYGSVALAALWVSYVRVERLSRFVLLSLALVGVGLLVGAAAVGYEEWQMDRRRALLARIEVTELEDEVFRSPAGNPIGIRIRFAIRFPEDGSYWIEPWVRFKDDDALGMSFRTVGPSGALERWEGGRTYRLSYDLVPIFIGERGGKLCLRTPDPRTVTREHELLRSLSEKESSELLVSLGETPFSPRPLRSTYSSKEFYEAFVSENPPVCP